MNFILPPWLRLPTHLDFASLALLVCLGFTLLASRVRTEDKHRAASTPQRCINFHAAARHPETLRNTQHFAPRLASGVEQLSAAAQAARLMPGREHAATVGVMQAGGVRGSAAGIICLATGQDKHRAASTRQRCINQEHRCA